MNKTLPIVVALLSGLIFASCMKISKKNDSKNNSKNEQALQVLPSNAEPEITSRLNYDIGQDEISFRFPKNWPESLFIEVVDQNQRTTIPINLNPENKSWGFIWPSRERKLGFVFRTQIDKTIPPLKEIEIWPPLFINTAVDIDLISTFGISSNVEKIVFQHITLSKRARLFLKTFTGEIIVNELYSESGAIQTFPTHDKAATDQPGLSGGRVSFKILSGEGQLSLLALGQNGGDGSQGPLPDENLRGGQGEPGTLGEFEQQTPDCSPHYSTCYNVSYVCVKNPSDSRPGYQGKKGYRGNPGQNGGNSGSYSVSAAPVSLKINTMSKEGKGGRGGPGGGGGPGGYGGEIGDGHKFDLLMGKFKYDRARAERDQSSGSLITKSCAPARKGNDGPQGPEGDFGLDGLDGVNEALKKD